MILAVLIFLAVAYVAANVLYLVSYVVFWVCRATLRVVGDIVLLPFRLVGAVASNPPAAPSPARLAAAGPPTLGVPCGNAACLCPNIAGAKFCRRCGAKVV